MIQTIDVGWAAGFLEGEGSFIFDKSKGNKCPVVSANQVEIEPLVKLLYLFGGNIYDRPSQREGWKETHVWRAKGVRAVGVMFTLYPQLSSKRRLQIRSAINIWREIRPSVRHDLCRFGHPIIQGSTEHRYCRVCQKASYKRKVKGLSVVAGDDREFEH